ncbi:MAG: hypothetical protein ABS58_10555 [Mesorhizobium sp. SCN 65-20]|nr:MAG: hypothetical protein ABS58_10555 [Mesorhizobium sp. SCN 65-20]
MQIDFTHCPGGAADSDELHPSFFSDTALAVQRLRLLENAGFRRVMIDDMGGLLVNMDLASLALRATHSLGVLVSHWPGIVAPVVAARQFATLAQLGQGRLSLRVPASRGLREAPDGLGLAGGLGRTDEYLVLLRRLWSNARPFDHEGAFYRVHAGYVPLKPAEGVDIPIQNGGLSGTALKVASKHADLFELPAGGIDETRQLIERVKVAAQPFGRTARVRFSLPVQAEEGDGEWNLGASSGTAVARLVAYAGIGVTDFLIHGLEDGDAIESFGRQVIPQVQRAVRRYDPTPMVRRGSHGQLRRVV